MTFRIPVKNTMLSPLVAATKYLSTRLNSNLSGPTMSLEGHPSVHEVGCVLLSIYHVCMRVSDIVNSKCICISVCIFVEVNRVFLLPL